MLERHSPDADVSQTALPRRDGLLARGDLDEQLGRVCGWRSHVNDVALVFDPEPPFGRAADLLHDRAAARARRQSGAPWRLIAGLGCPMQRHVPELTILLHRLERFPIDEDHPAPPEIRAHVDA